MNKKKSYTKQIWTVFSFVIILTMTIVINNIIKPNERYKEAIQLFEDNKLEESNRIFTELGNYKEVKST